MVYIELLLIVHLCKYLYHSIKYYHQLINASLVFLEEKLVCLKLLRLHAESKMCDNVRITDRNLFQVANSRQSGDKKNL